MPRLNVAFMTRNTMLADTFDVKRRADVVGSNGRTTPTQNQILKCQRGVVTPQDPGDLIRNDDGQMVPRKIFVATTTQILQSSAGQQPDLILWNSLTYVVTSVQPFSRFGEGTYQVMAESMTSTDPRQ